MAGLPPSGKAAQTTRTIDPCHEFGCIEVAWNAPKPGSRGGSGIRTHGTG